jgi:hypothetical protein
MRINRESDGDPCPVTDDMLGQLYRSSEQGLPALIATVAPDVRAQLATYCYRRGHLRAIGLAIASTCDEYDLVDWGGTAGAALFARSREAPAEPPALSHYAARRRVTLASAPLRIPPPIDDEPEPDVEPEPDAESEPQAEPELQAGAEPQAEAELQAEVEPQTEVEKEAEPEQAQHSGIKASDAG